MTMTAIGAGPADAPVRPLLSCPFCGSYPRVTHRAGGRAESPFLCFIACACGGHSTRAHQIGHGTSEEEAFRDASEAWNRRHDAA